LVEVDEAAAVDPDAEEPIAQALAIDDVKIELGYGLLHLINDLEGRRLTDQIKALRRTLATEFGFVMPPVRILDNMRLANQGYAIRIKEMEAGTGEVRLGSLMAMDPAGRQVELPGEHVREPAFGLPATWIDEGLREEATFHGYTLVDPATVLTTHLTEILKENMADLLSYAELQKLLKDLPPEQKKLVDEVIPSTVSPRRSSACCRPCCASASPSAIWAPSLRASARPPRTTPASAASWSTCARA
jgi:flagellar biosynthesis protein FlhA